MAYLPVGLGWYSFHIAESLLRNKTGRVLGEDLLALYFERRISLPEQLRESLEGLRGQMRSTCCPDVGRQVARKTA